MSLSLSLSFNTLSSFTSTSTFNTLSLSFNTYSYTDSVSELESENITPINNVFPFLDLILDSWGPPAETTTSTTSTIYYTTTTTINIKATKTLNIQNTNINSINVVTSNNTIVNNPGTIIINIISLGIPDADSSNLYTQFIQMTCRRSSG